MCFLILFFVSPAVYFNSKIVLFLSYLVVDLFFLLSLISFNLFLSCNVIRLIYTYILGSFYSAEILCVLPSQQFHLSRSSFFILASFPIQVWIPLGDINLSLTNFPLVYIDSFTLVMFVGKQPSWLRLYNILTASLWRSKIPLTSFLDMTQKPLIVELKSWSSGECEVPFIDMTPRSTLDLNNSSC